MGNLDHRINKPFSLILLVGGFGTRLRSVIQDLPKPMAPINGRPFLEYLLEKAISEGADHIVLATGYQSNIIQSHFGDQYQGAHIDYSVEISPLGTGGALRQAIEKIRSPWVCVANGDSWFNCPWQHFIKKSEIPNTPIVLGLCPMKNFERYGKVTIDQYQKIVAFQEKQYCGEGLINAGIYAVQKDWFLSNTLQGQWSLETDLFPQMLSDLSLGGVVMDGDFIDIGIPEDYAKAQDVIA